MQDKEQIIIQTSGAVAKVAGSATAVGGFWQWIVDHHNPILLLCTVIGVFLTVLTYQTNKKYQKRKDEREQLIAEKQAAVLDYQLKEMQAVKEKKRRRDDQ